VSSPGSGLGSSFGTGVETAGSYGTLATIGKWLAVDSCEIKQAPVYYKGEGLHGGTLVREDAEVVRTNLDSAGSIKAPFYYNGLGRLIGSLMGSLAVAPSADTSPAYTATHAFANSWHQSLSIQQCIPDVAQAAHYWNHLGVKVTDAQFECSTGNPLLATFNVDCQDTFEASSGTSATEPGGSPFFAFHQMAVKVGAFGSEVKVDGVSKWTGAIKRAQANKRFNAGNVTTNPNDSYAIKDEPVDNGFADITGTLDTEYLNDTLFENYYQTDTPFSLIVAFTSATLAAVAFPYSVTFAFPRCRFLTGENPTIAGPDIVKPVMAYEVMLDGTHPAATITVVNTDVTL
jgi:hypothetical protein